MDKRYARKGEMAIVVGSVDSGFNGKIVKVLSDPYYQAPGIYPNFGLADNGATALRVDAKDSKILASNYSFGKVKWVIYTHLLVPIRDPDQDTDTETQKENNLGIC